MLLDRYGEYLLINNTHKILIIEYDSDFYKFDNFDKEFCKYAKKYPEEFEFLLNNYNFYIYSIQKLKEKNIESEFILKNINKLKILKDLKEFDNLTDAECKKLLNFDIEKIINIKSVYNKIINCEKPVSNGKFTWTDIKKFLLTNPTEDNINFLDNTFKEEIKYNNLNKYFRNITDMKQIKELIIYFINNNHSIQNLKQYIEVLVFKFGGGSFIDFKIDELSNDNLDNSYPANIRDYIKLYNELKNIDNIDTLMQYIEKLENFKILTYDELCEFLIVNYNKNLNKILLNPEKLESLKNVSVRYQPISYEENGQIINKNVKIITIRNIPFTSLSTSIGKKPRKACLTDEQYNFNNMLVDHPNLWLSNPSHGTNYISMSANKHNFFKTFGDRGQIIAGFCNIKDKQIKRAFNNDAGTNMDAGTAISSSASDLESIDKITKHSIPSSLGSHKNSKSYYNEVISDREGIIPDYFFGATSINNARISLSTDKRNLKWAAYFDKPIIEIDCESYYKEAIKKFYDTLEEIRNNPLVPTLEDLKKLEVLKVEAETFYQGHFIDYYDMIISAIDMKDRIWNLENIKRLEEVIKAFNENLSLYDVNDSSLLREQKQLKEKERMAAIQRLTEIVKNKRVELNNIMTDSYTNISDSEYSKK